MDQATSGQVLIDGEDIAQYSERKLTTYRRNSVGFVFQNYNLVPNLTAKENVELMIQIAKSGMNAQKVLEDCGLGHRLDNFPAQLSGGEQQRVSIARAIAGALDYETGKQILQLLQDTSRNSDTTVIVITHNTAIAQMADRVIEIRNGKVKSERANEQPKLVADITW